MRQIVTISIASDELFWAIAMPLIKTANVIIEIDFFCKYLLICVGRFSRVENGGGTGREEFLARAGTRCASN
jgi:hypothetical protein